jgi:hypothetical protein
MAGAIVEQTAGKMKRGWLAFPFVSALWILMNDFLRMSGTIPYNARNEKNLDARRIG